MSEDEQISDAHYCNNCGCRLYFPERGILAFDGRFCDQDCKDQFDFKRTRWNLRIRK